MKVRDSGMPEESAWEQFFDAASVLRALEMPSDADMVDFDFDYGAFSISAATLTTGTVYALDSEPQMVAATAAKASRLGLANVQADFVATGTGLASGSVAYAMLFNILHAEDPLSLLREAFRVLRPGGSLASSTGYMMHPRLVDRTSAFVHDRSSASIGLAGRLRGGRFADSAAAVSLRDRDAKN